MHRLKKALTLALFAALACTSCQTVMTGIAPSSTPITADDTYTILSPTKGKAYGVSFFGIPMSEPNPSRRALNRAIAHGGGNSITDIALIEVTEDFTSMNLFILTIFTTRVRGTAIKIERGGADR